MNTHCLYCDARIEAELSWAGLFGFCGVQAGAAFCADCRGRLAPIGAVGCTLCGRPADAERAEGGRCRDCVRWERAPSGGEKRVQNRSLYRYNGFMQEVLAQYKYRGDAALAEVFAPELARLGRSFARGYTAVPVPLAPDRLLERGFNQAALLAAGLRPREDLLVRTGTTAGKQSKRGRNARLASVAGCFAAKAQAPGEETVSWGELKIVLVDDLYTTGATLQSIGEVFYQKGVKDVRALTLARAGDVADIDS
ncbi:competence protein ComFC [Salisediminibacterium halotolerans]|nr:competence protein ComFC [Actinophytocola xinjiangensis]RPE89400.1 competence protein ComFC [Salisediminibacterium halotolerans]TWG36160.1 competence protein ComFC [Salisediminibacterium halotolerans]